MAGHGDGLAPGVAAHADFTAHRDALARHAFLVNAAGAVRETPEGTGAYALQPHEPIHRDLAQTGFISGRVNLDATNAPAAGMIVTAQAEPQGQSHFQVLLTTLTRGDGTYTLDLLPTHLPQHEHAHRTVDIQGGERARLD